MPIPAPDARPADILTVRGISKRFGITQALDAVSCAFAAGEVHALMGENGAGKSTLGKVIAGLHRQDAGTVTLAGRELRPGSLDDAFAAGVRIVHQELAQCPNLSVAENLCLHELPRTRAGLVDRAAMQTRAARLVHRLEPTIDVARPLGELSPGHRQICQIAAALDERTSGDNAHPPRVIVFDEPTSSLSLTETQRLLEIVRRLAADGLTVLYVSHRMSEIFACCDRVTVLRDGRFVATSRVADLDEPALVEQMIGRRIQTPAGRLRDAGTPLAADTAANAAIAQPAAAEPLLEVRGLSSPGRIHDITLAVRPGEVVGLGGLVGAGRSELLDAIFGLDRRATGTVRVAGRVVPRGRPRASIAAGLGYVPEDRRQQGLFFNLAVDENILAPVQHTLAGALGLRRRAAERRAAEARVRDFQIKTATLSATRPGELSGGNQQKLLIARWMHDATRVLLLDEPTRGIDVGTKAEIYRLIHAAADRGTAVLLVSSEMPELLALSDRVLVMADGRVQGELAGDALTQSAVLTLATREHARAAH
jgi:ABC-type sugar transport system ATPase subunit